MSDREVSAVLSLQAETVGPRLESPREVLDRPEERLALDAILGVGTVRIAVEATVSFGWDRLVGPDGVFVGMNSFGASAPADDLYTHFGITAESLAETAKRQL